MITVEEIRKFCAERYEDGVGKPDMFIGAQQLAFEEIIKFIDKNNKPRPTIKNRRNKR